MTATPPEKKPVRYEPSVEKPEPDEAATFQNIVDTMRGISETVWKNGHHAHRSVHAKSVGLLRGTMSVPADLPDTLKQGLFATPGTHPVVMRFSTNPGDILDDEVSTPRGLAVKVLGVAGERLPGAPGETQDFVLVDAPTFAFPSAKKFLGGLKLLAGTTDKAPGLKKILSAVLQGAEAIVEGVGVKSGTLISLGGHPETNVLGETYYSQAAIRYGDYVAKLAVAPASDELKKLTDAPVDLKDRPDGLREAVVAFFAEHGGEWDVKVQLCTDLATMPIEDPSVLWPEKSSPYVAVARISVPPQDAWNPQSSIAIDDGMAFSPWHGLAAHRPLGSLMRARRAAYEMSSRFRAERNKTSVAEPTQG